MLSVSCARRGSTSIDTRPSSPLVLSKTGLRTSQALRTSSVVSVRTVLSTSVSRAANSLIWSSYAVPFDNAAWKIDGLVVTPTTDLVSISSWSCPELIRSRDRSSSHTETPAADNSASFSFCVTVLSSGSAPLVGAPLVGVPRLGFRCSVMDLVRRSARDCA
ncbi:Uncharacterised protein [Mycobacteroides abscessus subsp. abscessus]|nr:Uncharacterised protein [Mycobacteroides abscessus subsp. abscessus]